MRALKVLFEVTTFVLLLIDTQTYCLGQTHTHPLSHVNYL